MYLLLLNYCRPYLFTIKNPNLYYYPLQILWLKDKKLWELKVMFYILTSKIGRFYLIIIELILPPRRFRNCGLCTSLIKITQLKRSAYLSLVFKRNLEWFRSICPPIAKYFHSMYLIPNHFVSSLSRKYLIILMYFCFQKSRTYFALWISSLWFRF